MHRPDVLKAIPWPIVVVLLGVVAVLIYNNSDFGNPIAGFLDGVLGNHNPAIDILILTAILSLAYMSIFVVKSYLEGG